ncbi:MAG TPA: DUF488 family protein [Gemmata sp.]
MTTDTKPRLFSVGYQHLQPAELVALVIALDAILIDCRSAPSGRVKRGFARADLEKALEGRYEWRKELGGRDNAPTVEGLKKLAADERRLVLMCMEHSPAECHRHHKIAMPLAVAGVDVWHVYEDEVVLATDLQRAIDNDDEYEYRSLEEVLSEAK